MKLGVLGSGMVGRNIGGKLAGLGHEVRLGTREPAKLADWQASAGARAATGSFAEAAAFGEIVFNCTAGAASLEALRMAGEENLNGKILIDLANSLDFSKGMPPTLLVCNTDSLGEQIQRAFPGAKVVKTLNTMNTNLMVQPGLLPGEHDIFMSGNDAEAKRVVEGILRDWFGWQSVIDLGDISTARGTEMMMPVWLSLMSALKTPMFNFKIVRQSRDA